MKIKNYTTSVPIERTAAMIEKALKVYDCLGGRLQYKVKIKRLDRHKETRAKLAARLRSDRARESLRVQVGRMRWA